MTEICIRITQFVKFTIACLVPATISVEHSTGDVTVVEGETVSLVCNVSGMPTPDITWFRRPALGKTVQRQSEFLCTQLQIMSYHIALPKFSGWILLLPVLCLQRNTSIIPLCLRM